MEDGPGLKVGVIDGAKQPDDDNSAENELSCLLKFRFFTATSSGWGSSFGLK